MGRPRRTVQCGRCARNAPASRALYLTASADRFNYDYDERELAELARKIGAIAAESTHVVFNNNYEDQGQRNARTLTEIIFGRAGQP